MPKQSVLVVADDDKLYKDPLYAGMVDNDLIEFFVCFDGEGGKPEVVIERIPNYRPHRGADASSIWNWYAKAAAVMLNQLGFVFMSVTRGLACTREFGGVDLNTPRSVKAMSFHFDLAKPIPAAHITHHDGIMDCPDDRPPGAFVLVIPTVPEAIPTDFDPRLVEEDGGVYDERPQEPQEEGSGE